VRVKSAIQRWPPESFCGLPNPDTPTLHLIAPTRKDQFHGGMSHCSQACSKAITQSNTKSPLYFLVFWKLLITVVVRPFQCQGLFSKGRQVSLCEKGGVTHHSISAVPPAATSSSFSFSASSLGMSAFTTWGVLSTNFLACTYTTPSQHLHQQHLQHSPQTSWQAHTHHPVNTYTNNNTCKRPKPLQWSVS